MEISNAETLATLGPVKGKDGITFSVWSMEEDPPVLLLYKKGKTELFQELEFPKDMIMGNIYTMKITGLSEKEFDYAYRIGGEICLDPYARVLRGKDKFGLDSTEAKDSIRCGLSFEEYDWEGDRPPALAFEDAIMYKTHIRGFTKHKNSKVRHKGTFLGVTEKVDYLEELGINQLLLQPVYEFQEVLESNMGRYCREDRVNYWGYTTACYFAPKHTFTAGKDPVKEFKDMVKALHKRGIEVLLEFYFTPEITFGYMMECLRHWVSDYHVDGFHIIGRDNLTKELAREPVFSGTKLICSYFPVEEVYAGRKIPLKKTLCEFNEGFLIDMRKILKSDEDQLNQFATRLRRNPDGSGVINYLTNHDGFTMMDLVSYDVKHNQENNENNQDGPVYNYSWNCGIEGASRKRKIMELRKRQIKNGFCLMLLAQGTPMILGGDEVGNSQKGNNNPYCHDSELTWIDWQGINRNRDIYEFVKELIAFRKEHKILHTPSEPKMMDSLSCGYPDLSYHGSRAWYGTFENTSRSLGVMYNGLYGGGNEFVYIAYNFHWNPQDFALPNLPAGMSWYRVMDTVQGFIEAENQEIVEDQKSFITQERSVTILVGRK